MTNPRVVQLALESERIINRLGEEAANRLIQALDRAFRELDRQLRESYPTIANNDSLLSYQRNLLILEELGETLQLIKPEEAEIYRQMLERTLETANELGQTMGGELIRATAPGSAIQAFGGVPARAVAIVAEESFNRLQRHGAEFASRATAAIEQSLIQGWGPRRLGRVLEAELGITKGRAERIARTETMSAFNRSASQRYAENGVEGEQWLTTQGEVCPYCSARSGNVYRVGEALIPAHPHCRCILVPWKKAWQDDGLTDDEFIEEYARDRLRDLGDIPPNYGPTPFEKAAGLTEAPSPLWQPNRG